MEGIFHSGRLCYPRRGQFRHIYDEIRNEAIQNLFFFICNNIDRYQPERAPVMRWANYLLACRFFEEAIGIVLGDPRLPTASVENYDSRLRFSSRGRTFPFPTRQTVFRKKMSTVNLKTNALKIIPKQTFKKLPNDDY